MRVGVVQSFLLGRPRSGQDLRHTGPADVVMAVVDPLSKDFDRLTVSAPVTTACWIRFAHSGTLPIQGGTTRGERA
jgi:hypothetical protein